MRLWLHGRMSCVFLATLHKGGYKSLRIQYADVVSVEFESVSGTKLDWDVLADVMKRAAFRVVGAAPRRHRNPWLQGKEHE